MTEGSRTYKLKHLLEVLRLLAKFPSVEMKREVVRQVEASYCERYQNLAKPPEVVALVKGQLPIGDCDSIVFIVPTG